jgi:hypothetical protein
MNNAEKILIEALPIKGPESIRNLYSRQNKRHIPFESDGMQICHAAEANRLED